MSNICFWKLEKLIRLSATRICHIVCFITMSFLTYSFFHLHLLVSTMCRPFSSYMCSITLKTAICTINAGKWIAWDYAISTQIIATHCSRIVQNDIGEGRWSVFMGFQLLTGVSVLMLQSRLLYFQWIRTFNTDQVWDFVGSYDRMCYLKFKQTQGSL